MCPELKELIDFYEKLFQMQIAFKEQLRASKRSAAMVKHTINPARFSTGDPQVIFNELQIEQTEFIQFFNRMLEFLNNYLLPGKQETNLEIIDSTAMELAQNIFESRNPVIISDTPENLTMLAAGLALMPYLQTVSELMMPHIDQSVWQRNYCPICGGKPSFASLEKESGTRSLLCSRCSSVWRYGRVGCPFCDNTDKQVYYSSDDGRYRLYVCDRCKRYIKAVDLRMAGTEVCLLVENILTVAMDIAAQEKGYRHY